eukprot:6204695-Prymnesium_polylepis.1
MMVKTHVLAAVEADYCAVREKLPEYAQARICRGTHLCATLCATSCAAHCTPLFAAHLQIFGGGARVSRVAVTRSPP